MELMSIFVYKSEPKVKVKVKDNYGRINTVYIEPCYESWEQYGANTEVLYYTMPIAEKLAKTSYFKGKDKDIKKVKRLISNIIQ